MGHIYPYPDNEDGFEQLCLRFYRSHLSNDSLQLYGKRGERQNGIDIYDPLQRRPVCAIQCKQHDQTKSLLPSEIKGEVAKAEQSTFEIERYIIATTAKKSRKSQDCIAELNRREVRKFTVELHAWEDICGLVCEQGNVTAEFIIYGQRVLAASDTSGLLRMEAVVTVSPVTADVVNVASGIADTIDRLIRERKLEAAEHDLEKLCATLESGSSTLEHRYQAIRLKAKLALEHDRFEEASRLFIEAFDVNPTLEQAKCNRVLGYMLSGDSKQAHSIAHEYIDNGLATSPMLQHFISTATSFGQIAPQWMLIEQCATTDASACVALAHFFVRTESAKRGTEYARRAVSIDVESPHAHLALAMTLHSQAFAGPAEDRVAQLQQALQSYDRAEELARQQKFTGLLPELLHNRGAVHAFFGRSSDASADFQGAVRRAHNPSLYAERAVGFFIQQEDFDTAWDLLPQLDRSSNEAKFLSLVCEFQRSTKEEARACIDEMLTLASVSWERTVDCRVHCVQWALSLEDEELARSFLTDDFERENAFLFHVIRSWIAASGDDLAAAISEVAEAFEQSTHEARASELRLLSDVCVKIGDNERATILLQRITVPGLLNADTRALIGSAQQLGRDDVVLRICRELRESDVQDERLRKLEVQLLSKYSPSHAIDVCEQAIAHSEDSAYFRALRNLLAVRLKLTDRIDLDSGPVPEPPDLSPREAPLVVRPLTFMGRVREALDFLYEQRRFWFEDESAHASYIFHFLRFERDLTEIVTPELVEKGCAARLVIPGEKDRWILIEDSSPIGSRGEFSSDSEFGRALLGRKLGSRFEMPGNVRPARQAEVAEIQTKYVRAFQDSIEAFGTRFPNASILQEIRFKDGDEPNFTLLDETVKERREFVETCFSAYLTSLCPLHLLAQAVGVSDFEVVGALANRADGHVWCSLRTDAKSGIPSWRSTGPIVLTMSSIVTLTMIDGWRYVRPQRRLIVAQSIVDRLELWIEMKSESVKRNDGWAGCDNSGRLVFKEGLRPSHEVQLKELNCARKAIEERCEVVSTLSVASLDPKKRDLYESSIGRHDTEAIAIAKDEHGVLWCDDLVVSQVARGDFGIHSVSTQVATACLAAEGRCSWSRFDRVTAGLIALRYVEVLWRPETIVAAAIDAKWNPRDHRLSRCIDLIEAADMHPSRKALIVSQVIMMIRRSCQSREYQHDVIHALLDAIGDRASVEVVHRRVDRMFEGDLLSREFVRREVEHWLRRSTK